MGFVEHLRDSRERTRQQALEYTSVQAIYELLINAEPTEALDASEILFTASYPPPQKQKPDTSSHKQNPTLLARVLECAVQEAVGEALVRQTKDPEACVRVTAQRRASPDTVDYTMSISGIDDAQQAVELLAEHKDRINFHIHNQAYPTSSSHATAPYLH